MQLFILIHTYPKKLMDASINFVALQLMDLDAFYPIQIDELRHLITFKNINTGIVELELLNYALHCRKSQILATGIRDLILDVNIKMNSNQ